jgi:hypothetical protein
MERMKERRKERRRGPRRVARRLLLHPKQHQQKGWAS